MAQSISTREKTGMFLASPAFVYMLCFFAIPVGEVDTRRGGDIFKPCGTIVRVGLIARLGAGRAAQVNPAVVNGTPCLNGTAAGTYLVADIVPGPGSSFARPLALTMEGIRETLFFSGGGPTPQLWVATPQLGATLALGVRATG